MRIVSPELLWLHALIPILAIIKGRMGRAPSLYFPSTDVAKSLAWGKKSRSGRLSAGLKLLAIAALVLGLARPQFGNTTTEVHASGIDILLAVDVSGSMQAMDFTLRGRRESRLEVVKNVVTSFVKARPNDRIGLVAFAGKPYLISPLTLDHDWTTARLKSLTIGMFEDGTAIGSAIGTAVNRLRQQQAKSRIVILLTDGVSNSGKVPQLVAAKAAEQLGIKIYTIGAGSHGQAQYPVIRNGRKHFVKAKVDIDEQTLQKVAEITGARYFRATDTASLERIYKEIDTMEATTRTINRFDNYRELFPYCLLATFICLAMGLFINRNRFYRIAPLD